MLKNEGGVLLFMQRTDMIRSIVYDLKYLFFESVLLICLVWIYLCGGMDALDD